MNEDLLHTHRAALDKGRTEVKVVYVHLLKPDRISGYWTYEAVDENGYPITLGFHQHETQKDAVLAAKVRFRDCKILWQ